MATTSTRAGATRRTSHGVAAPNAGERDGRQRGDHAGHGAGQVQAVADLVEQRRRGW